ncbi:MAG: PEP-CTERM sorting domain-containing protein [Bryobacteraceae bacterium]
MKPLTLIAVLGIAGSTWATTTTSVTCTATGAATVTNPNTCSTGPAGGLSSNASSAATVSADFLTYSLNQTVNANFAGDLSAQFSSASATGEVSLDLSTAGPVRQGYLKLLYSPNWATSAGDFTGAFGVSVGSVSANCNITAQPSCAFPLSFSPTAPPVPFTLGQSFLLDFKQTTTATGEFVQGSSRNNVNTGLQIQVLEADGVTRVALAAVPEPATWLMTISGIAFVVAFAVRRSIAQPGTAR